MRQRRPQTIVGSGYQETPHRMGEFGVVLGHARADGKMVANDSQSVRRCLQIAAVPKAERQEMITRLDL